MGWRKFIFWEVGEGIIVVKVLGLGIRKFGEEWFEGVLILILYGNDV